jgi:hypothetical protein
VLLLSIPILAKTTHTKARVSAFSGRPFTYSILYSII